MAVPDGGKPERAGFFNRISVRITIMVLSILSLGIGITVYYFLKTLNSAIIESRRGAILAESNVLFTAVKNSMLAGEAPIAVDLFRDLARIKTIGDVRLYRADGQTAFSDNRTLRKVNRNLGSVVFKPTKRLLKENKITDLDFFRAVKTTEDIIIDDFSAKGKSVIFYKPLKNFSICAPCHGRDHTVRGVIRISSSLDQAFASVRKNIFISAAIYGAVVLVLSLSILVFLRHFVIRRIYHIGTIVEGVGRGDFKTKITAGGKDEIGTLGMQINAMIDGLRERFKLARFVSKSTLEHVREEGEVTLGGEKKTMTVLFSDIRGFTSFSENRDPEDVMRVLNEVMNLQGSIIHEFGGDIDKFVGDELMAVFEGDDMVLRALRAADKIRRSMKEKYSGPSIGVAVGIGINTGEMISGNMGSGERLDRTVIGDAVNLGARLCSVAGKNVIVISEHSYEYVKGRVEAVGHDPIRVKGKEKPVVIYTVRSVS